jgi:hypothetical protein
MENTAQMYKDYLLLQCLYNASLDNWEGYSEALKEYYSFLANKDDKDKEI